MLFMNTKHVQRVCAGTIIGRQNDKILLWSDEQDALAYGQSQASELGQIACSDHPVVYLTNLWSLELSSRDSLNIDLQSAEDRVETALAELTQAQEALALAQKQRNQSEHWCDRMSNVL